MGTRGVLHVAQEQALGIGHKIQPADVIQFF